jgi:probable HAF family extracellular repeat protein
VPSGGEAVADAKATASPWSLTTIAPLPGDLTLDLSDVNDAGTVVGSSNNVTGSRAFLRIGTTTIPLGTADRSSAAWAVSNGSALLVAGTQRDASYGVHPTRWTVTLGATPTATQVTLDDLGGAWGINDQGDLAGVSGADEAVIWPASGGTTVVAPPSGSGFVAGAAYDINNAGHVVGMFSSAPDRKRAFLRLPNGALVLFETPDHWSEAKRVSEVRADGSVVVAGTSRLLSSSESHGIRWTVNASSGAILDRRVVSEISRASGLSDAGDLGGSLVRGQGNKPVIWTDAATFVLPVAKSRPSGDVVGMSPSGRHAVGRIYGTSAGSAAIRWGRQ